MLATIALVVMGLMARPTADQGEALSAADIFRRVEHANVSRAEKLQAYSSLRRYAVLEPGHEADAELVVSMQFVAPSTKSFKTLAATGVGWIHKRVFRGLMDAERQAAVGAEQLSSAITPANYEVRLVGEDQYLDRDCYVLELTPKRYERYLFKGKAWIDKDEFAIAKVEGEPVKSPSFWVTRAPFVREYQRIDTFWLPVRDETHSQIRFVGEYILRIAYTEYRITGR